MKKSILLTGLALCTVSAHAQCFKEGYVDWGYSSTGFADAVLSWQKNQKICEDDNFFISRVKPKARFRNAATQIRNFDESHDKKLLAWIPINNPLNNALPDGKYDSEVFNMWSYVTHYGDWTASLGHVPAALIDVAHKNGVAVSGVAGIPYGAINMDWRIALSGIAGLNAQQAANFLRYYGNDGLGYNSEFSNGNNFRIQLREFHSNLVKASADNPIFENIWYDGTNDFGSISFDQGLSGHNQKTFGDGANKRTSLFLNYNWNSEFIMNTSVTSAEKLKRSSLDLYAGINMQGAEPKTTPRWTMLKDYPISIGLWGAHERNMFWESRNEQGSADETKQRTYMLRTERWFTGGTRNPANCPEINNSLSYALPNTDFHGMSSMMSARSSLSWDLAEEPFVTFFNLGNGKFFNWKGIRQNNNEWYNIGIQDYLPTWRYWFASTLLGKTAADVPANGLDAEFIWDDAYVGGSCMRIFGSTDNEYLHLFKTKYAMQAGDLITLRYKLMKGSAQANLVLTAEGDESTALREEQLKVLTTTTESDEDVWVEKTFTVGDELAGKNLALIALHFTEAKDLNLYLGELSIVRHKAEKPAMPEIVSSKVLAYHNQGIDGKLIFNMPNDKPAGTPCYNLDVKTSLFKIYAQQEGGQPVCMGATSSWAALLYKAPVDFKLASQRMRFGVSAVSLDTQCESDIAWSDYNECGTYTYSDDITLSKTTIKPNEPFEMSYTDPNHESGTWKILNQDGQVLFEGQGHEVSVEGLKEVGSYDLLLNGMVGGKDGQRVQEERRFNGFVRITPQSIGALPEIKSLTANGQEADIQVNPGEAVNLTYTGRTANGSLSRGLNLKEKGFGFSCEDAGFTSGQNAWTCSFWVKFNSFAEGEIQFFDVRYYYAPWPYDNWGVLWSTYNKKEKVLQFTIRGAYDSEHTNYWDVDFAPGVWTHVTLAMEKRSGEGVREHVFINGLPAKCVKHKDGGVNGDGYNENYSSPSKWWHGNQILIGHGRHQCAAMDAVLDDVKFFNTELKEAEVKQAMNSNELLQGQSVFYSFEKEAKPNNTFDNEASATVASGLLAGKGSFTAPIFDAGCPFISGSQYEVTTTPSWKAKKAVITEAQGNDKSGSAKVTYAKDGIYDVTLTLTNSYGSDSKTFKSITVCTGATGIEDATLEGTEVMVENGVAIVNFASAGHYNVRVYNAAGQLVASKAQFMTEGQHAQIALGHAGVYVLQIEKDGQTLANVKLLNK